jgi:hypothetical protein
VTGIDETTPEPGAAILRGGMIATAVFLVAQVVADIAPDSPALAVAVAISLAMFAVGAGAFIVGFLVAVGRSREEAVTLGGLFLLAGTAPERVRRALFATLAAQVVIALVTAGVRPFTPLAFGILAPMLGVGFVGLWAARHGSFFTREQAEARAAARSDGEEAPSLRGPFDEAGEGSGDGEATSSRKRRWWEPADDR